MSKRYVCHNVEVTDDEDKIEELFNKMADKGYRYVNSFPANCGGNGRIYSVNHIFERVDIV